MLSFFIGRLGYGMLVLLLVSVLVSAIVHYAPVDPARLTFGQRMDETTVAAKRKQLGLDLPLYQQVLSYIADVTPVLICQKEAWLPEYRGRSIKIGNVLVGVKLPYLRSSYQSGRPVSDILTEALPNTLYLATISIFIAMVFGILLGVLAALQKGQWLDHVIVLISTLGYSIPSYVTAILLGVIFGYYLRDFTGLNIQGSLYEINDIGDDIVVWKNIILPSLALGVRPVSIVTQLMRSSMLEQMEQKYVLTALAKGLSMTKVVKSHILKNALNPVITALSGWFASLLAGAFFVEFIFNFKGLGFITVNALLNYDIPVVLGALLLTSSVFIIINIMVDMIYRILDPRITFS